MEKTQKDEHKIALPSLREVEFVPVGEIIRCESSNSYTTFYLTNGEKITVSKAILEYEEILKDYGFIRCHQCHLVNKKFISSWRRDDGDYLVVSNTNVPIAKLRKEFIREQLTGKA